MGTSQGRRLPPQSAIEDEGKGSCWRNVFRVNRGRFLDDIIGQILRLPSVPSNAKRRLSLILLRFVPEHRDLQVYPTSNRRPRKSANITVFVTSKIYIMDTDMQEDGLIPLDISRPAKRRKFYRKRSNTEDNESSDTAIPPPVASPDVQTVDELVSQVRRTLNDPNDEEDEARLSVTNILRQRKAAQRRRGGIEFSNFNISSSAPATPHPSDALMEREDEVPEDIKSVVSRFAPQTGQVSESVNDKHMYVFPIRTKYLGPWSSG